MSATATPETPVDEKVDTSDLDLLDDELQHYYCVFCFPSIKPLDVVTAACGQRVVNRPTGRRARVCAPCNAARKSQTCPVCGRSR